jgi:hypothetical protein
VPDKHIVLNDDAFTDKGVAGDFAVFANTGILLDFHKRTDFCFVSDHASVQIDEFRKSDVFPELNVVRDAVV